MKADRRTCVESICVVAVDSHDLNLLLRPLVHISLTRISGPVPLL
jgi:hypothetical protein